MDALGFTIAFAIGFVVFGLIAVLFQVRNMKNMEKHVMSFGENGSFMKGMMPMAICGMLSTGCLLGTVIALLVHLFG